jgi:WD40 repeat protein
MMKLFCAPLSSLTAAAFWMAASVLPAGAQEKITYADHVLPIIENNCAKCHNPDKHKGDLDLTTYQGVLKGGGSGAVVVSGNPDSSKLWKAITQVEDPTMPPNKPPLPEKELAVFKKWIAGGLLESSGSKAIAAAKPTVDLSVKVSSVGKPDGPPPMPRELPIEPVVHTTRGNPINGLAASPWSPLVVIAGQKQILIYNTTNLDLLGILPFSEGQPWDLKFSRSGKLLLAGGGHSAQSGKVILWNIETGERIATIGNEYDIVLAADISPDQTKVALGGPDRLIKIYSTKTGELEHKIKKHTDWVTALAFSPNGVLLVSGDRNGGVSLWDPDNGQELFTTPGHKAGVTAASWRGDSRVVATSGEDGSVKIWDASEGKQARTWNAHSGGALCVAYTHDGRLVTCGRDGSVTTWSADGNKVKSLAFFGETALRCAFSHDGTRVIATDFAGRVAVWESKDGKRVGELDANPLPLDGQLAIARKRLEELQAKGDGPSSAVATAESEVSRLNTEVETARAEADKAKADFTAKAQEVVRLKAEAAKTNAPAEVADQLAVARKAREQARPVHTNTVLTLEDKTRQLTSAREKLERLRKTENREAELAAAQAVVTRLTIGLSQSEIFRAREAVATKQRELDQAQAVATTKQELVRKLNGDLTAAKNSATKSKLRAELKAALADAKTAEAALKKAAADLSDQRSRLDKLSAEHERMKTASALSQQQSRL